MLRFEDILEAVESYLPGADEDLLRRAYIYSAQAHKHQLRSSGEPYLVHPIGLAVGIDYSLHLGDGRVVDSSEPGQPLTYLHGEGQIVPGLESALAGLSVGDQKQVVVAPAEGYGEHDPRGLQEVPRSAFPPGFDPARAKANGIDAERARKGFEELFNYAQGGNRNAPDGVFAGVAPEVIRSDPNRTMIPDFIVQAICPVPHCCHPSYAQGYYDRDNPFYIEWDKITSDQAATTRWLDEWVYGVKDRDEYWQKLGEETHRRLAVKPRHSGPVNYGSFED